MTYCVLTCLVNCKKSSTDMSTWGIRDVWILLPPSYSDSDVRRTASFHSQQRQDLVGWIFLDDNSSYGGMNYPVTSLLFIKRILGIRRNPVRVIPVAENT